MKNLKKGATQLKATGVVYTVSANCTVPTPTLAISLMGHSKPACNSTWTINPTEGVIFPVAC